MEPKSKSEENRTGGGLGSGTAGFFADVVQGIIKQPDFATFKPILPMAAFEAAEAKFNEVGCGNFDRHIYCSIPTFFEMQRGLASAIVASLTGSEKAIFIDLGASEGGLAKVVASMGQGTIRTVAVDPNEAMMNAFESGAEVEGASFDRAAIAHDFGTREPYTEGDSAPVPYYAFGEKGDVISEIMLLQFLEPERVAYLDLIDNSLNEGGIAIFCEKFLSKDDEYYAYNEFLKDEYKAQYFPKEELEIKALMIIKSSGFGMESKQVRYEDFQDMLSAKFKYAVCFWDAGNFKGYACSQSMVRLQKFLDAMPDLNSVFSTYDTPFAL